MTAPLAGCAAPGLEAQVDEATKPSACESVYLTASHALSPAVAEAPLMMRYLAARTSATAWLTVASTCDSRFAEGAMRAAQASFVAGTLAERLGVDASSPEKVDYDEVVSLDMQASALDAISLGEDRAGFSVEVLAARGVDGATLALSDNHKTAAQRLFSLSGSSKDPRRKVYAVDQLIAHPDTIADPANGITADTVASIEMNCARAYLDAVGGKEVTGADGSSSPSPKTLAWLARMASARAWRAMELGYPSFDAALFD
ncbi:hypothetical protein [Bifidobacterium sp. CP2]|nr:hypothetical protein [Bifidobacterium sp. CP2]